MPVAPENIAVPLDGVDALTDTPGDTPADALSAVLEMIHLRGADVTSVREEGRRVVRHPRGDRVLHLVVTGTVELRTGDGATSVEVAAGDLALMARGGAHRLHPGPGAQWLSGRFLVDEGLAAPVLAVLPPAVLVRAAEGPDWLPLCARLLAVEVGDPRPGSHVMVSRILDLLFIQALRAWSAQQSAGAGGSGWLVAALDHQLGPALTAIHLRPEHPWTVDQLADLAMLSRAAFAARFGRLVGEPPGRYLQRIRLARAAELLTTTTDPVGAIGRAVGYASEAAFSRAFSREHGTGPRAWRSGAGR